MKEFTCRFVRSGGLLISGTDSPNGATLPGWSLHQELELFVQAGISPMKTILAATLNNAEIVHQDKELGSVETGKYADLVILNANPLDDIRQTRNIYRVIKDGRVLDPEVLLEQNIRQFGERGEP